MRKMTMLLLVLLSLIDGASATVTGTATLTASNFNAVSGVFTFDVYGLQTSLRPDSDVYVGTSNFYFSYNTGALASPTLLNVNAKYNSGGYYPMTVQLNAGKVAVTIQRRANPNVSLLSNTSPNGELLFTISMQVSDATQPAHLQWDVVNSALTDAYGAGSITNTFAGSDEDPLPIQLSSFTGTQFGSGVRLEWSTVSEINNYGFYVQRRPAGETTWPELEGSFVAGHGTTNTPQHYSHVDNSSFLSGVSYRLRQVDLDGTVHFSEAIQIRGVSGVKEPAPVEFALKQNYPNPFNPSTEIKFSVEKSGKTTLEVYNLLGQRVTTLFDDVAEAGRYYRVRFNGSNAASGVYLYKLQSGQRSDLKKLLLLK